MVSIAETDCGNTFIDSQAIQAPCRLCGKEAALGIDGLCESCEQIREALEG